MSASPWSVEILRERLGGIDIYLLDQLLRGHIANGMSVVEVGCGGGRNLIALVKLGLDVWGFDPDPNAVAAAREAMGGDADRVVTGRAEAPPFAPGRFDVVVLNAVLHFAHNEAHFSAMLDGAVALARAGGRLFTRLTSDIGLEGRTTPLGGRLHRLPDGSTRFLVDREFLASHLERLGATLVEPLKTVNVSDVRCMTTWVFTRS